MAISNLRRGLFLAILLGLPISNILATPAFSQQGNPAAANAPKYETILLKEELKSPKAVKDLETAKKEAFRGSFDIKPIQAYYRNYLMPLLTSLEDPLLANTAIAEIRADLYMAEKLDPASLKIYNDDLFLMLSFIASRNYRPSAVINATLLIGEMNETRQTSSAPSKPYGKATAFLINAAEKGASDGVKAAALVGLERHIRTLGPTWDERLRDTLAGRLLSWSRAPRPASQSLEAHAYLSARYLQLTGLFRHTKGAEALALATDILANEYTHPILREQALAVMGATPPAEIPADKLVAAGRYSMRYMKRKLEDWNDLYDMSTSASAGGGAGAGGYTGAGGMGAGYGDSGSNEGYGGGNLGGYGVPEEKEKKKPENPYEKQDEQTKVLRRYMHELLQTMRFGLSGKMNGDLPAEYEKGLLAKLPDGAERELVEYAVETMQELQVALNSDKIQSKADLATDAKRLVDQLIAIADEYPGAIDLENELIIEEAAETPLMNEAVGIQPDSAADEAPASK